MWSLTKEMRAERVGKEEGRESKEWAWDWYEATYMSPQTHSIFFLLPVLLSTSKRSEFFKVFVNKYLNPFTLFCLDTLTASCLGRLLMITEQDHGKASKLERRKAGSTWKAFPWSLCRNTVEIPTEKRLCTTSGTTHIRIRSNSSIAAAVLEHVGMQNMITSGAPDYIQSLMDGILK